MKCETNLEAGLRRIRTEKRPGMVIIHKSWCGTCKKLKPRFLASKEINRLSQEFVMISLEDDAEPNDKTWVPDGKYFPRIFFVDVTGRVMKEIVNGNENANYKYFYQNETSLVRNMDRVLCMFRSGPPAQEKNAEHTKGQVNTIIRRAP